jgi:Family of unknown function (DUF6161)
VVDSDFNIELRDAFANKIQFTNLEQLRTFIEDEQAAWQWINESGFALTDLRGRFGPNFSAVLTWIQQYKDQALTLLQLRENLNSYYNPATPPLVLSDHAPGANVLLIRDALDADHACLALAMLTGVVTPNLQNLLHARLWSMLALPATIEPNIWLAVERDKLAKAREALRRELGNHRHKISDQQDELTTANTRSRERYRRLASFAMGSAIRRASNIGSKADDSIEKINATNAAFTLQMQLKAPVGYWNGKRTKHRIAAIWWSIGFAVYLIVAGCLAVYLFGQAWTHAEGDGLTGRHFLLAAGIGTVLTLIFWISRVLMRIFLGELHLYTDAEERSVMTETYLALIKEGAATEQERALILAALFRSAQDGIVREDIGGEVGIAAVAAKMLESRK